MDNFVIVTATRYERSDCRLLLAKRTVQSASDCQFQIVVIDDSDDPYIEKTLTEGGATVLRQETKGFGNAIRQAIHNGARWVGEGGVVAWQEPEKIDMIFRYRTLIEPIWKNRADMIVPQRTQSSLATYPIEQVYSEQLLNRYAYLLSGKTLDIDLGSGVRIFKATLADIFTQYDGVSWDTLVIPVIQAARNGYRIKSVDINYMHPLQQTVAEEGKIFWCEKRLTQLQYLIPLLKKEWNS